MLVLKGELAILMIIVIGGMGRPQPQSARDKLQPLVETLARRLAIAKQVALAKWDSPAPVEDAAREARVIAAAIRVHRERPSTLAHGSDYPSRWRRGDVIGKQKSHERKPGKEARPAGEPIESKDGAPLGRNRRAKSRAGRRGRAHEASVSAV